MSTFNSAQNPVPTAAARVAKGKQPSFKRRIRMEQAARLEGQLYKDAEIAQFLDMTVAGLAQLKADPEYAIVRMEVLTGVVSTVQEEMIASMEYKHERMRAMIPQALQNLYDLARSSNENVKLKATAEILDREGTMAKVSRIGLATQDQGGVGTVIDDEIASNLLGIQKIQAERAEKSAKEAKTVAEAGSTTIQ